MDSGKGRTAAMGIMVCTPSIKNIIREWNYEQINSFNSNGIKIWNANYWYGFEKISK